MCITLISIFLYVLDVKNELVWIRFVLWWLTATTKGGPWGRNLGENYKDLGRRLDFKSKTLFGK